MRFRIAFVVFGSAPGIFALARVARTSGSSRLMIVSKVWSWRCGSQFSIHAGVGVNLPVGVHVPVADAEAWLVRDAVLFDLSGILPRAFSDMPLSWCGTASSTRGERGRALGGGGGGEVVVGDVTRGVGVGVPFFAAAASSSSPFFFPTSSSLSSSSPIANGVCSSCTCNGLGGVVIDGVSGILSKDVFGLASPRSFFNRVCRSISSCPLSSVKFLNASNRLLDLKIA